MSIEQLEVQWRQALLGQLRVVGLGEHRLDMQRRLLTTLQQRRLTPERRDEALAPDPHAVERHELERQHALVHQRAQNLRQRLVECLALLRPELREAVVPDLKVADDPAQRQVGLDPTGNLSGATDPQRHCVQPQAQLHPRRQLPTTRAAVNDLRTD